MPDAPDPGVVTVSTFDGVCEVLRDRRLGVLEAPLGTDVGTLAWFRSAVSRFTNGDAHEPRRSAAARMIASLDPSAVRTRASQLTRSELGRRAGGTRIDVMPLAALVPTEVLAAELRLPAPGEVAALVLTLSGGYFPGSSEDAEHSAEAALKALLDLVAPDRCSDALADAVTRLSLLVQGCAATAALIGNTLDLIDDFDAPVGTDAYLDEACRFRTPTRIMRRVVLTPAVIAGVDLPAGTRVVCDVAAANQDPARHTLPDGFDPGRPYTTDLTFGHGIRPCPGPVIALALAGGVVDAVRELCVRVPGASARFADSPALRIPSSLEVLHR